MPSAAASPHSATPSSASPKPAGTPTSATAASTPSAATAAAYQPGATRPAARSFAASGAGTGSRDPPASRPAPSGCVLTPRSEEHTSELQSLTNLVCRLLLEKKKEIPARAGAGNQKKEPRIKST